MPTRLLVVSGLAVSAVMCTTLAGVPARAQIAPTAWTASLEDIRRVAALMPGRRPLRLNMLKFAESHRTKNFSVKDAPALPSVQARTAFQVMYADGSVMVDAGMNLAVHKFFGRGADEPYFQEATNEVDRALTRATMIVVTGLGPKNGRILRFRPLNRANERSTATFGGESLLRSSAYRFSSRRSPPAS
jgi:hypothetical protein